MVSRRLVVIPAIAAALFAAAAASATPLVTPATLQCDGATYLTGGNTHNPNPSIQVTVQDSSTGLRFGQAPMGAALGVYTTRELWVFNNTVTAAPSCLGGTTGDYVYNYTDSNNSDTMVVGECQYSDCTPAGTLTATVQIPLGQTACPSSPPAHTVSIFSGGQGGNFGTAATFDGTAVQFGSVTYNQTGLGDRPPTYTLSAWIKSSGSGKQTLISEQEANGGVWGFGLNGTGLELFDSRNTLGGQTDVTKTGSVALNNGAWHKVDVVRLDGQYERFFIDGVDIGFVLANSSWSFTNASSSSPIMIGTYEQSGTRNFDGQVNGLRVMDSAMTDNDIFLEYQGSDLHLYAAATGNSLSVVTTPGFNPAISDGDTAAATYYPGETITRTTAPNQRWIFEAQNTQTLTTVTSTFTVTINSSLPSAPQSLVGTPTSTNAIEWSWSQPASFCQPPGSASVYYQMYDAVNGGGALSPPGAMTWPQSNVTLSVAGGPNQLVARKLSLTDTWGTGPLTPSASAYTEAAAPTSLTAASVSTGGFIASWSANANPGYTRYELSYTTDPNFLVGISTPIGISNNFTASSAGLTGLLTGTTYYFRVRAFSGQASDDYGGAATAFDVASVVTVSAAPSLSGTPLTTASVQWNWTQVSGASGYELLDTPTSAVMYDGAAVSFTSATLSPNTLYRAEVEALQPPTPPSGFGQGFTYTLANPPSSPVVSAVYPTSATFNWSANGNPSYTFYEVVISTDPAFAVVVATLSVSAPSATAVNLLPGVVYYSSVAAVNGVQIPTAFVGIAPLTTPVNADITVSSSPNTPYSTATGLVGVWQLDEGTGTTTGDSSGNGNTGSLGCQIVSPPCTSTPTWTAGPPGLGSALSFPGLTGGGEGDVLTNSGVPFAFTGSMSVEAWVNPQTLGQIAGAGIVAVGPQNTESFALDVSASHNFRFVLSNGVSEITSIAATATIPVGQWTHVVGVYDAAHTTATLYLNGTAVATVPGMPASRPSPGSVLAIGNRMNTSSAYALPFFGSIDSVRVFDVALTAPQVLADYIGSFVSSVTAPAPNTGIVVGLPPNAFGAPAQIYISADPAANPIRVTPAALAAGLSVPPSGLTLVPNSLVEVVPVVGGLPFTGLLGSSATLTIPYNDPGNTGIISGTNPPLAVSGLQMYTLNTAVNAWAPLPTYTSTPSRNVVGVTPHFSVFALFAPQTIGSGLASVHLYPVPWKPGSGGRFDATGVTFADLPATGTIRILTLAGQRVRDFTFSGVSAGTAVWDGNNDGGHRTASGVYFARITSGVDGTTTILKFAIER